MDEKASDHEHQPQTKTKFENIVITREETDKFGEQRLRINHGKLRKILLQPEIGNKPVAFISITGCKREGKSFLLNYVLRYLRNKGWQNPNWMGDAGTKADKDIDIEWKHSRYRHTTGIRIFEEKFEVPIGPNKTMIVMIMDTQGLFDFKTPEQMNKAILTLSTMLSSVQIFNVMRHIDAQHIQYLETCVDFAQETSKQEHDSGYLKLQRLMFLVRDHPEDQESDDVLAGFKSTYSLSYGDEILKDIFESNDGGRHQVEVRKKILKMFENVGCFPLPSPGKKCQKKDFDGSNKDLDEDFLNAVKSFVEEIAHPSKLIPKQSRRRELTAREILNTIAGCDSLFAEKMFEASMMVKKNVEGYYASEYQEAIAEYATMLEQRLIEAGRDKEKREKAEMETRLHALRRFDIAANMGSNSIRKKYRTDLQLSIGHHYKNALERFKIREKLRKTMLKECTRSAIQEYSRLMEDEIWRTSAPTPVENIHENVIKNLMTSLGDKIIADEFKSKATEIFRKSRGEFEKWLEESIQSKTDGRESELLILVQLDLREECEKLWNEKLLTYCPVGDLEHHRNTVDQQITQTFWAKAVNRTEYKYVRMLYAKLGNAKNIAKQEAGWCAQQLIPIRDGISSEDERNYANKVDELVDDFSEKLRIGIKEHLEDSEDYRNFENKLDCAIERKFYQFCNKEWNPALDKLENMLENEWTKAQEQHEKLWDQFRETVHLVVDGIVLEHEKQFNESMCDKHIEEGDFEIYYAEAIAFAKQFPPESLEPAVTASPSAIKCYESVLEVKMTQSRLILEARNVKNKEMRPIRDCSDPPPKETSFHKFLGWLRRSKHKK